MNKLETDVYMVTEHKRDRETLKDKKTKVNFKAVVNRVLVGALVLTTVATSSTVSAWADTVPKGNPIDTSNTITVTYEQSTESALYNLKSTHAALEAMVKKGIIDSSILLTLAENLISLDKTVSLNNTNMGSEIMEVIKDIRVTVASIKPGTGGLNKVNAALTIIEANPKLLDATLATTKTASIAMQPKMAALKAEVKLTDISGHWAKDNIEYLVQKGGIAGYTENGKQVFKPNQTISKCEFLKIALYSATPSATRTASDGKHWASGVFVDSLALGVLKPGEMPRETWNDPINRYEMTMIMTRISSNILKEKEVGITGISNIMEDYSTVQQKTYYTDYVEQAFMRGLITGVNTAGKFNGAANGTRGEAATMVTRLIDASKRVAVNVNKPSTGTTTPQAGAKILKYNDAKRPQPKAGDIFEKADGTQVTLKIGPSGVLGEGQNCDLYGGMAYTNGNTLKHGSLSDGLIYPVIGATYLVDSQGEGHFWPEWKQIIQATDPSSRIKTPSEGQTEGKWWVARGGEWSWRGPVNKISN